MKHKFLVNNNTFLVDLPFFIKLALEWINIFKLKKWQKSMKLIIS